MISKLWDLLCWFTGQPTIADKKLAQELIAFEELIAEDFHNKLIPHPIHLNGGDAWEMIKVFKGINKEKDWVFGTWRGHWISYLKGVPPDDLRKAIHSGRSIGLCFDKHRVMCSAIVGGIIPIALGTSAAIAQQGLKEHVWVFVGDMSAETGVFHEAVKYATYHSLPITFVVSDNGKSVMTDTRKVWNMPVLTWERSQNMKIIYYKYDPIYPHSGTNKGRIQF